MTDTSDERRERYAAAMATAAAVPWTIADQATRSVYYEAADAAMAIANAELEQPRTEWNALMIVHDTWVGEAVSLRAKLARVRSIHNRGRRTDACNDCGQPWPCEVTRALDESTDASAGHAYLSTSCLHGEHGYCQSHTGLSGAKTPSQCKFCGSRCQCPCHRSTTAEEA